MRVVIYTLADSSVEKRPAAAVVIIMIIITTFVIITIDIIIITIITIGIMMMMMMMMMIVIIIVIITYDMYIYTCTRSPAANFVLETFVLKIPGSRFGTTSLKIASADNSVRGGGRGGFSLSGFCVRGIH